jgi:predicted pyridoxine 5'-phosphate oxidase superfamily flavin-nucleotide-binding protein
MRDEIVANEASFHAGEIALQREAGVAERLARAGPQVMRSSLPEQHREFFPELPFLIVGSLDARGQPSASLLAGPPGFVFSPDPTRLRVDQLPSPGSALRANLQLGAPLGLLGIQAHTRRRNRVNGSVTELDRAGFSLDVRQSFGNCPKYIHAREAFYVGVARPAVAELSEPLDARARALISAADTFYLASAHPDAVDSAARSHGVDVSHRGGPPGFVQFSGDSTLVVPDFRGNNFFKTLGNLQLHSRAGLLFMDRARGDLLELEASAELVTSREPLTGPSATGRSLHFHVQLARFLPAASPLRFGPELSAPRS